MPRLPDATSLGRAPSARTSASVPAVNLGRANQASQELAQTAVDVAAKIERRQETEAFATTMAEIEDQRRQKMVAGENAVLNRNGDNAKGSLEEMDSWFEETRQKYADRFKTNQQQQAFNEWFERQRSSALNTVAQHEEKQREVAFGNSLDARANSAVQDAAAFYTNPKMLNQSRQELEDVYATLREHNGWDQETYEARLQVAKTKLHAAVIDSAVEKSPEYARDYYEQHKDEIAGTERAGIEKLLDTAGRRSAAQKQADNIMSENLSDEERLARARNIGDPELRDEVVTRVTQRINEEDVVRQNRQSEAADEAWSTVVEENDIDAIPMETWNVLSGQQQRQIRDYMEARAAKEAQGRNTDNYQVLDRVEARIESGDITDKEQLRPYHPFLRDQTIRSLRDQLDKREDISRSDMRRAFESRIGDKQNDWNDSEWRQWVEFQDYILRNAKETKRPEDMDAWANKWFMDAYSESDSAFSDDPDTYGEYVMAGRADEALIETPEEDTEKVRAAMDSIQRLGGYVPEGRAATDEFYTNSYLSAQRFFEAQGVEATPEYVAAYALLKDAGKPLTMLNVIDVANQMQSTSVGP